MTARRLRAAAFTAAFDTMCALVGYARALLDEGVQQLRRLYLEACAA